MIPGDALFAYTVAELFAPAAGVPAVACIRARAMPSPLATLIYSDLQLYESLCAPSVSSASAVVKADDCHSPQSHRGHRGGTES